MGDGEEWVEWEGCGRGDSECRMEVGGVGGCRIEIGGDRMEVGGLAWGLQDRDMRWRMEVGGAK